MVSMTCSGTGPLSSRREWNSRISKFAPANYRPKNRGGGGAEGGNDEGVLDSLEYRVVVVVVVFVVDLAILVSVMMVVVSVVAASVAVVV